MWVTRLDLEHDNLRAALRWAINHGSASTALRLVGALARFWELRGYFNEAFSSIQAALAVAPGGEGTGQVPGLRALALSAGGLIAERQGNYSTARGMLTEALELYRVEENRVGVANALNNLALLEAYEDYDRAIELHMQSLELRREVGDLYGVGASLINLSYISMNKGEHSQARAFAEEALEIQRKLENHWGTAHSIYLLAMISLDAGDIDSAVSLFEESIALCRKHDYRWPLARMLLGLGQAL